MSDRLDAAYRRDSPAHGTGVVAAAVLILPLLAVMCLAIGVALLGDAATAIPAAERALGGIAGPGMSSALALRVAIETGAIATAATMALAWPFGLALGVLPWRWAVVARALLAFPAATLLLTLAFAAALLAQVAGPLTALLVALRLMLAPPLDLRLALVALALPWAAAAMAARSRLIDRAAMRAAMSLGMTPPARFRQLVLPELLPVWLDAGALIFVASLALAYALAGTGLLHQAAGLAALTALPVPAHALASLAAAIAGAALAVRALARIVRAPP